MHTNSAKIEEKRTESMVAGFPLSIKIPQLHRRKSGDGF